MTSSPGPTPTAASEACRAAVQEFTATACLAPVYTANSCSKRCTLGPVVTQPERRLSATSEISSDLRAAVQEFTAPACLAPVYTANSCSKRCTLGPVVTQPERRLSATSEISSDRKSTRLNSSHLVIS